MVAFLSKLDADRVRFETVSVASPIASLHLAGLPSLLWMSCLQANMLEVEAAYNESWEEASQKLPALIDRLMCVGSLMAYMHIKRFPVAWKACI